MNRDRSILGIHIDDDFLNIVHLGQTANGLQVHNWAAEPLKADIVKDGLIIDEQAVSQKIRDFVKANQLKSCKAVMSLACSTVRLKPSEFPAQTDEQLQKQVEEQIGKYSLFEGQKVVFDYCVFEETTQSSNKQIVLQAVTARQISDACLTVAQRSGLDLVRIEPSVLPIIKLAYDKLPAESDTVSLLLALDSVSGNMSVFKDSLPQFCRNLGISIKDLSQNEDAYTSLTDQMKPILEFAHSLAGSQQLVLRVAASCRSDQLHEIIGKIKQSLRGVAVEQIDPAKISKQFDIKGTNNEGLPIFAFASALTALGVCEFSGKLNLVSQESLAKQKTQKEMSLTAKAIVATVLLSVAAIIPLKMKIRSVEGASAVIEAKVAETVPMKQKIAGLKKQIEQLEEKQSAYAVASLKLTDIPWLQPLQVIGNTVPDKVRIVDISTTDSGELTLVGEALAEEDVYRFAKRLQNTELIDSAKVEEIEYDDSNTETIVDYKITCKIQLPEGNL